jgi:hypothetical protein
VEELSELAASVDVALLLELELLLLLLLLPHATIDVSIVAASSIAITCLLFFISFFSPFLKAG